jgi:hypothetical protein
MPTTPVTSTNTRLTTTTTTTITITTTATNIMAHAPAAKRPRGPSAYMLFTEEQRPHVSAQLKAAAPDGKAAVTVVAKALGELWGRLSDDEREGYRAKAAQRAARER